MSATLLAGERVLLVLAGLAGAAGVALSAVAAHRPGAASLDSAARFLLIHAALVVALVALLANGMVSQSLGRGAGWVVLAGLALFCGDIALRTFAERPLAPMAAPTGGSLLILGWLLVALAGLVRSGP